MVSNEHGGMTYYEGSRNAREAKRERAEAVRYFEKQEAERYRATIADLGKEARTVREQRKAKKAEARQACNANLAQAKERSKDKAPHRRRAEVAKARVDCAFDVMNIEEQTAQNLEAIEGKRDKEMSYRRSSRLSARHNRQRDKAKAVPARVQREEMFDRVRHDLDPDLLPFFEEQKSSPHFRKLLEGGRMTPTEAILQMAHDDPEAVLAAFERVAAREIQAMIEQWEQEGGRPGEEAARKEGDTDAPEGEEAPRTASERKAGKRGRKPGSGKRGKTAEKAEGKAAANERAEKGARVRSGLTVHDLGKGETVSTGITRDGDEWVALAFAESKRFKREGAAVRWLAKRGFHADGTRMPKAEGEAHGKGDADGEEATRGDGDERDDHELRDVNAAPNEKEADKACACKVPQPEPSRIETPPPSTEQRSAVQPARRLSAEERTAWIPGTEPTLAPSPAPVAPGQTTLFEEEGEDVIPETPDARRPLNDTKKPGKEPYVQQAFGTDFTNWLNQAGSQLTLDAARAAPARRPALPESSSASAHGSHASVESAHGSHASVEPARAEPAHGSHASVEHAAPHRVMEAPATRATVAAAPTERHDDPQSAVGAPLHVYMQSTLADGTPRYAAWRFADATLEENRASQVLQVWFDHVPPQKTRFDIRAAGFRWWAGIQRWQAPLTKERRQRAEEILREYAMAKLTRRKGGPIGAGISSQIGVPIVASTRDISADREMTDAAGENDGQTDVSISDDGAEHDDLEDSDGDDGADSDDDDADDANDSDDTDDDSDDDADDSDDGDASLNPYERKQARRAARMRARADALQAAADATYSQARARAGVIPFGQPIQAGHYSAGRDRRFRDKIHKGYGKAIELQGKAEDLRRRANFAESGRAISSDDPDAIEKLEAKVEQKRGYILQAKRINEVIRAARAKRRTGWEPLARERLTQMGIETNEIEGYLRKDFAGRYGVPGFALRNATGEIARLNRRIDDLKRRDARPVREAEKIGEAMLSEDRELNRVQIRFEGVPSKEVRNALRGAGFVWAPSTSAWQRKLTESATWRARYLLRELYPAPKEPAPVKEGAAVVKEGAVVVKEAALAAAMPTAPHTPPSLSSDVAPAPASAAEAPCEKKGGLCVGATVYAVGELKARDNEAISSGASGTIVDATCEEDGPCLYMVRWGKNAPSWHDATEITTDPSLPF